MKILAIIGSATQNSSNKKLVQQIISLNPDIEIVIFDELHSLPHFRTELTDKNTPQSIIELRNLIDGCDGILFSTPEYIFSIPGALKNLLEWCVSTMVFDNKPAALITASASGEMGHKELKLILTTLGAKLPEDSTLLLKGIKGKLSQDGRLNEETSRQVQTLFVNFLKHIVGKHS